MSLPGVIRVVGHVDLSQSVWYLKLFRAIKNKITRLIKKERFIANMRKFYSETADLKIEWKSSVIEKTLGR